jgi:hypothetical protein
MSAATRLAALYPPSVRERWGAELSAEISRSGMRSWPDALAGAGRLWLRPRDWPETSSGQTRRVLTVMIYAFTALTGLLLRSSDPSTLLLTADARHPATSLWLAPLLLGGLMAVPIPAMRLGVLGRLTSVAIRSLAAPAVAVAVLLALAWGGVNATPASFASGALKLYYLLTLGFVALRLCRLIARTAGIAAVPSARRLFMALTCLAVGLTLAAVQSLAGLVQTSPQPDSLGVAVALALLAATTISAARDVRPRPATLFRGGDAHTH